VIRTILVAFCFAVIVPLYGCGSNDAGMVAQADGKPKPARRPCGCRSRKRDASEQRPARTTTDRAAVARTEPAPRYGVTTPGYTRPAEARFASDRREQRARDTRALTLRDVRWHYDNASAAFIDARPRDDFDDGHVPGAYNVPADYIDQYMEPIWRDVPFDQLIIVYCEGGDCDAGERVAEYLRTAGYARVHIFRDGWNALDDVRW